MKRGFLQITRGKIIEELHTEGLTNLTPLQFLRIEKKFIKKRKINPARRTGGNWRVYTREEADLVKKLLWEYYGGRPE
jgi:hypothetical protein